MHSYNTSMVRYCAASAIYESCNDLLGLIRAHRRQFRIFSLVLKYLHFVTLINTCIDSSIMQTPAIKMLESY